MYLYGFGQMRRLASRQSEWICREGNAAIVSKSGHPVFVSFFSPSLGADISSEPKADRFIRPKSARAISSTTSGGGLTPRAAIIDGFDAQSMAAVASES
jgi:hypothetical protein